MWRNMTKNLLFDESLLNFRSFFYKKKYYENFIFGIFKILKPIHPPPIVPCYVTATPFLSHLGLLFSFCMGNCHTFGQLIENVLFIPKMKFSYLSFSCILKSLKRKICKSLVFPVFKKRGTVSQSKNCKI